MEAIKKVPSWADTFVFLSVPSANQLIIIHPTRPPLFLPQLFCNMIVLPWSSCQCNLQINFIIQLTQCVPFPIGGINDQSRPLHSTLLAQLPHPKCLHSTTSHQSKYFSVKSHSGGFAPSSTSEDQWLDEWVSPSKLRGINWLFNRAIHWRRDTLCLSGLDEWFNECLALYPRMSEALAWEHTRTTSLVQFMAVRFASSPHKPRHLSIAGAEAGEGLNYIAFGSLRYLSPDPTPYPWRTFRPSLSLHATIPLGISSIRPSSRLNRNTATYT